jgi:hypothetical protein
MKTILSTSILALAGLAFAASSANAALSYNEGDLVFAFSTSSAPNHTGNTYLVDFGNVADFQSGGLYSTGNPVVINTGLGSTYLSDLTAAGITNFSTATWSISGGDFLQNVWVSKAETTRGVASTPHANGTDVANTDILTMVFSLGTAAANSNVANSFIQNSNDGNSYAKYNFGQLSPTQSWETYQNIEGSVNSVIDLYAAVNGSGNASLLGAFGFNSATGAITFSSDVSDFAVPEPGTFAFGVVAIGACLAGRFRTRRQTIAELVA